MVFKDIAVCLLDDIFAPQIAAAEKDFLVVYKPPRMHSAPGMSSRGETLLDWCAVRFPEIASLPGRSKGEGGLLHRLDFETQGLLLIARTFSGMENLLAQQSEGKIVKEYSAAASLGRRPLPGFPKELPVLSVLPHKIESAFRPFGRGRKAVRPLIESSSTGSKDIALDHGRLYITEILESSPLHTDIFSFRVRITKGFRHQIRCHLAWTGNAILNDLLYGGRTYGNGLLALRAVSLSFNDPASGKELKFAIPPLDIVSA